MSAFSHTVFVLDPSGRPLTPTTPTKARKLLAGGVAARVWSKFGTFGIRMLVETRHETPRVALGVDHGTKFEGYSVVADHENSLNVKLDLPDKGTNNKKGETKSGIRKKLEERRRMRRARRHRKCRRRPCRSKNRSRRGFLAPSQKVLVDSRLKVLGELCRIYPVTIAGVEDVKFHHAAKRWGANFSTVEIGKARLRQFYLDRGINATEYEGHETAEIRQGFGYRKIKDKGADRFESHCCDSLALACAVDTGKWVEPGPFLAIDDIYRPVRRQLHDAQPAKGGKRDRYSTGIVAGLRKGLSVGTKYGPSRLCGATGESFYYHDPSGKRRLTRSLDWICPEFIVKPPEAKPTPPAKPLRRRPRT
jgi:RRXRR protein